METKEDNKAVFIRSDGWVYTGEGMDRLKAGGMKGKELSEKMIEEQIGKRCRVRRPIDPGAFALLRRVKGLVPRAIFVSSAIMRQAESPIEAKPSGEAATYMWFTLTEDAYAVVKDMDFATFRGFVSTAIRRAAAKRRMTA